MLIGTIIIFLAVLSALVLGHELGHFLAARKLGVRVLEFGMGLPPKMKTLWTDKLGTAFTLNWLPFGGFVAMEEGEADSVGDFDSFRSEAKLTSDAKAVAAKSLPQPYYAKPAWQRFAVIAAGPVFSIAMGLVAFIVIFGVKGIPEKYTYPRIGEVVEGSPAQAAGLKEGMAVVSVDGEEQESLEQLIGAIVAQGGQEITLEVIRDCLRDTNKDCEKEKAEKISVYVRSAEEIPEGEGAMGVVFEGAFVLKHPWYLTIPLAIKEGLVQSIWLIKEILRAIGGLAVDLMGGKDVGNVVAGPVGMVDMVQKTGLFREGFWAIVSFAGMLSINLGIMNFLPFPALDGGRLLLIALEKVVRRERIAKVERILNTAGFLVLIGLMVLVTGNDIWRLIGR
ncbi:RIP metalloprotease [Microgenomates group bacterium]|nr:RIP metalloprotease [Microgenomates group bacterium]